MILIHNREESWGKLNMNNKRVLLNCVLLTLTLNAQSMTDIDGNEYPTVLIGTQTWMAENLRVSTYANGESIPLVSDWFDWTFNTNFGAYCYYDDNQENNTSLGNLYNGYSVIYDSGLAPEGWHLPSDEEWQTLGDYLGGNNIAGGKLKSIGTTQWTEPNTDATNETDFSAISGGWRNHSGGGYSDLGTHSYYWSTTQQLSNLMSRRLRNDNAILYRAESGYSLGNGFSVRCVQDIATSLNDPVVSPAIFTLSQNYPNPFNPTTTIDYSLPVQSVVNLTVCDVQGKIVKTIEQSEKPVGNFKVQWNGSDEQGNQVSTGVYFARLQAGSYSQTIKMVFLK